MPSRTLAVIFACALLVGCAARPSEPALPADNPASPMAPEAPLPPESQTLATHQDAPPTVFTQESAKQLQPQMSQIHAGHGGHGGQR